MALLELVLGTVFFGQQCVNRFTYQSSGIPAAVSLSFALWASFGGLRDLTAYPSNQGYNPASVFGRIRAMSTGEAKFQLLSARTLYSVTDFYEAPFAAGINGTNGGEASSPFMAFGFRSARTRLDISRATKRFVGVGENAVGAGGTNLFNVPGSFMEQVANAMSATLAYDDEGNVLSFAPVVLGKQRYNPDTGFPSDTGRAYRLYPTEAEQLDHVASTGQWSGYDTIRSQTSRQYGRGV